MDATTLKIFVPEIFLSFFLLFQIFLNVCIITNFKNNYPLINTENLAQCFFVLFCTLYLCLNDSIEAYFFNFLFNQGLSVFYVKVFIILTSIFSLLSISRGFNSQNLNFFEYYSIFLICILSTLVLVCTSNLLSVYLVLEMQTLSFYILASFKRNSAFSTESGLKYFIIGSFISGLFLFGSSNIYGVTGSLDFNSLTLLFDLPFSADNSLYQMFLMFNALIICIVFLFKISAVPFHLWSPDVYEGAPLSSTIIFSLIPKFAIYYLLLKWMCVVDNFLFIKDFILVSAIFTIFLGSFMALKQKRFKRLLIFSSIAQTGFLLTAVSIYSLVTFVSLYFFLIIYVITSVLIWTTFSLFTSFQNKINIFLNVINNPIFVSSLSSFFKINAVWSLSNVIIFFSLAGIPPLAGFFSKLLIIYSVVDYNNLFCSFSLLIVSAISVFYYLRIIKIIFFDRPLFLIIESFQLIFGDYFVEVECALLSFFLFLLIFLFFYPSILLYICNFAVVDFF